MRRDLLRRLLKLETQLVFSERRLGRVAERLHVNPERLLEAAKGHEAKLAGHLGEDGTITWEGYLLVLTLLGVDPTRRASKPIYTKPTTGAASPVRTK